MDQREERVRLETERFRITGTVTLSRNGYRSRISDLLNASEREFLPLTDVTLEPLNGDQPDRTVGKSIVIDVAHGAKRDLRKPGQLNLCPSSRIVEQ